MPRKGSAAYGKAFRNVRDGKGFCYLERYLKAKKEGKKAILTICYCPKCGGMTIK